jgi:endonuclease/exonuclease/phosphatase family metal-dependent hydrolase
MKKQVLDTHDWYSLGTDRRRYRTVSHRFFVAAFAASITMMFSSCFGSCEVYPETDEDKNVLSIATWNVQALFDGHDDGWEYEEYRDGSGWSSEKYEARLNNIAKAISEMGEKSPDVIAFIEIENRSILEKLATDYLTKQGYKYCFFAGNPGYSLGLGVLSKYPFIKTSAHSINLAGEIIPRPIGEVSIAPYEQPITLFICHWKSKKGGNEDTEDLRREAARVILRREAEIRKDNPNAAIAVMGDLNECYDEFYRRGTQAICALLPDDPEAARLCGITDADYDDDEESTIEIEFIQDFLILSEDKPPHSAYFPPSAGVFYSPWNNELKNGSYFYSGEWETIDHFLLNGGLFDKRGLEFKDCFVMDTEPFVNSRGEPCLYNPRTGAGLSDHLPLVMTLNNLK